MLKMVWELPFSTIYGPFLTHFPPIYFTIIFAFVSVKQPSCKISPFKW